MRIFGGNVWQPGALSYPSAPAEACAVGCTIRLIQAEPLSSGVAQFFHSPYTAQKQVSLISRCCSDDAHRFEPLRVTESLVGILIGKFSAIGANGRSLETFRRNMSPS